MCADEADIVERGKLMMQERDLLEGHPGEYLARWRQSMWDSPEGE